MAQATFESGKLTPVYHLLSPRTDDRSPRLARANFDSLEWASTPTGKVERYAVPLGFERITDEQIIDNIAANLTRDAIDVGREFGFYTGNSLIVEQFGNGTDSWFGLHNFGYL